MNQQELFDILFGPTTLVPPGPAPKAARPEVPPPAPTQGFGGWGLELQGGGGSGVSGAGYNGPSSDFEMEGRVGLRTPTGFGVGATGNYVKAKWPGGQLSKGALSGLDAFYESPEGQRVSVEGWKRPNEQNKIDKGFMVRFRSPF